jgi:anti-sigma regulatory factor (Ser/Thr protein kinase)
MTPSTRLTHDALFYGSDDEFVATLVPFIRDGLAHDQAVAAAVTPANTGLLHDALGTDASGVTFIDRDGWYQRPATTVAGWHRLLADAAGRGIPEIRLIGEVGFGAGERVPTWTRYEAALNSVFSDAPAWIVCPYDTRTLPPAVITDAHRTHPAVVKGSRRDSDSYLPTEEFLRLVPEPMPSAAGPPALTMTLGDTVAPARRALRHAIMASSWSISDRVDDLVLAVSEIVANSICHGRGLRELRVWIAERAVVCEVADEGTGPSDPLAGFRPPDETSTRGRGLWMAHQLCDAFAVDRGEETTRIRLAITRAHGVT